MKAEKELIADDLGVRDGALTRWTSIDYLLVEQREGRREDREIPVDIVRALASADLREVSAISSKSSIVGPLDGDVPTEFEAFIAARRERQPSMSV